jgi:hypothetical protein
VDSVHDEVIDFFNWPVPCSHTLAQGSTQPLTEMNTRNHLGGKVRLADNLIIFEPMTLLF